MTGCELIVVENGIACLFKLRHDGYAVNEYFIDQKMIFQGDMNQHMQGFFDYYDKNYKSNDPDDEIQTAYPQGYTDTFNNSINSLQDFLDLQNELESNLEQIDDEDGLLCGYCDYNVFIDLDKNIVFFTNEEGISCSVDRSGVITKLD